VVGQDDVVVAEVARRPGHLVDWRTAVGPRRVRVAVAPQRGPQLGGRTGEGRLTAGLDVLLVLLLELEKIGRGLSGQRLADDLLGFLADAGQFPQRAIGGAGLGFTIREVTQHPGGRAERPDAVGRLAGLLQQIGDAVEGCGCGVGRNRGGHGAVLPAHSPQPPPPTIETTTPAGSWPVTDP
jgi:hypothetical protein